MGALATDDLDAAVPLPERRSQFDDTAIHFKCRMQIFCLYPADGSSDGVGMAVQVTLPRVLQPFCSLSGCEKLWHLALPEPTTFLLCRGSCPG